MMSVLFSAMIVLLASAVTVVLIPLIYNIIGSLLALPVHYYILSRLSIAYRARRLYALQAEQHLLETYAQSPSQLTHYLIASVLKTIALLSAAFIGLTLSGYVRDMLDYVSANQVIFSYILPSSTIISPVYIFVLGAIDLTIVFALILAIKIARDSWTTYDHFASLSSYMAHIQTRITSFQSRLPQNLPRPIWGRLVEWSALTLSCLIALIIAFGLVNTVRELNDRQNADDEALMSRFADIPLFISPSFARQSFVAWNIRSSNIYRGRLPDGIDLPVPMLPNSRLIGSQREVLVGGRQYTEVLMEHPTLTPEGALTLYQEIVTSTGWQRRQSPDEDEARTQTGLPGLKIATFCLGTEGPWLSIVTRPLVTSTELRIRTLTQPPPGTCSPA